MKRFRMIAILLAVVITLSGLAAFWLLKPTAVNVTKRVMKNLEKVESLEGDVSVDYEGPVSMNGLELDLILGADFHTKGSVTSKVTYMKGTVGTRLPIIGDIDIPLECYQQPGEGETVSYMSMDGSNWVKVTNDTNARETGKSVEEVPGLLLGAGLLQKIVSGEISAELAEETEMKGDREVYRMDVTVSGKLIAELLRAAEQTSDGSFSLPKDVDLSGADANLVLYIYKDIMLPASISIDCTSLGTVLMQQLLKNETVSAVAEKCVITMDNLDYNKIDELQIPESVINSAVEEENFDLFENTTNM